VGCRQFGTPAYGAAELFQPALVVLLLRLGVKFFTRGSCPFRVPDSGLIVGYVYAWRGDAQLWGYQRVMVTVRRFGHCPTREIRVNFPPQRNRRLFA